MEDSTKKAVASIGAGIAQKILMGQAAGLVAHGMLSANYTEVYVSVGMALVGAAWSLWEDFGQPILLSQLEVLKAKSLAQAAKMKDAGVPPITVNQIAAASPTLTAAGVTKAIATLPQAVQDNIAKAAVIMFAVIISGMMFAQPSQAAQLTGNLAADIAARKAAAATPAATSTSGLQKFMDDLAKIKAKVVDDTVADINAADSDAASLVNPSDPTSFRDPISHACYPAAVKFIQSLPVATTPTGTFIAVQLFQKKRDFVAQIQAGLPVYLKLGCAPLLGDEAAIFTKLLGLVGVKVALSTLIPGIGTLAGLTF